MKFDLTSRIPDPLRDLPEKAGRAATRTAEAAKGAHGKVVSTITQTDNWESVERYLGEVVQVLAAQEAEIADLRRQLADLTARLDAR